MPDRSSSSSPSRGAAAIPLLPTPPPRRVGQSISPSIHHQLRPHYERVATSSTTTLPNPASSSRRPRRRRPLLPSSIDLPCCLIVAGLLLCSISVGSLVSILGGFDGASTLIDVGRGTAFGDSWEVGPPPFTSRPSGHGAVSLDRPVATDGAQVGEGVKDEERRLAKARAIVQSTGGKYFVRDWPLWLGWNNIRYILEASAHQARLLNRTLVVPSHVVGRACEYPFAVCADWAPMVNRGKATGKDEWDRLPEDEQWAWLLPIELFLDFDRLQVTQAIITTADFLRLRGLDPADAVVGERTDGQFERERYLGVGVGGHEATYMRVDPDAYDTNISRVDRLPSDYWLPASPPSMQDDSSPADASPPAEEDAAEQEDRSLERAVRKWFGEKKERARWWGDVWNEFAEPDEPEADFRRRMAAVGVLPLETFAGVAGMEMTQSVVEPDVEASLAEDLRGWWDDFHAMPHEIFHLSGETHNGGRKPGQMRFTTALARDAYSFAVLDSFRPPLLLTRLAERMADRMMELIGGRVFLGAHARRGDFKTAGWVQASTPEGHIARVKEGLARGRRTLEEIHADGSFVPYSVPQHSPARKVAALSLPHATDRFYLATDERNATALACFRSEGAVFASDLLTAADRRELAGSWSLVFTDVVAVLEQEVLARSGTFYGHAMSSFVGGVVNRRAALGQDRRTALMD